MAAADQPPGPHQQKSNESERELGSTISYPTGPSVWRFFGTSTPAQDPASLGSSAEKEKSEEIKGLVKPEKWSMGVLNDVETEEVPGTLRAQYSILALFLTLYR